MRLREQEMPLDPEVERELDALDRALAGGSVDPDLEELAQLALELRSERPELSAEAEASLDELAASGFPPRRTDRVGRASRKVADGFAGLRRRGPRRLVPAFSAIAVFAIAIGVGVSQSDIFGGEGGGPSQVAQGPQEATQKAARPLADEAPPAGSAVRPKRDGNFTAPSTAHLRALDSVTNATGPGNRKVARDVDLDLSTQPDAFRDAADGVLDVVRDHRGFVLSSHVSGGDPSVRGAERGHASFDLRIPAGELSGAMGDLSDLGHVVSRSDGSHDITKSFVSTRQRIDDLTAARDRLLRQLGEPTTITEQQSIRARLRIVETRLAAAHKDIVRAQQRIHLVPVTVAIDADARQSSGVVWTIGDALHDAGRVLTVAAGAALVGGAALLPFALLAALGVGAWRGWVRRQRSRALDATAG